jgi:HD-like signal output (HDOD) protein
MGTVNIADIKDGMVLAEDLRDSLGRFLLAKGTTIEDKHIRVMKIWGVLEAQIEGIDREEAAAETLSRIDPEILRASEEHVANRFHYCNVDHPAVHEIRRLAVLRTADALARGETERQSPRPARAEPVPKPSDTRPVKPGSAWELVKGSVQLSSFPDIYYRIIDVINNPYSSVTHLAEVIAKDVSLSAKLLTLVNSAFYALPSRVDSIPRAVALIGINELSTLALGISAIKFFKDIPPHLMDMKSFWMHSLACGVFAGILAQQKPGLSEERFFVGGLLHDIGRLIFAKELGGLTAETMLLSRENGLPLFKCERETIGFDHAETGGILLKKWTFPSTLEQMVRNHHQPGSSPNPLESSIIHLANVLALGFDLGSSGEPFVPPLDQRAWAILGASPSILGPALNLAERQLSDVYKTFL